MDWFLIGWCIGFSIFGYVVGWIRGTKIGADYAFKVMECDLKDVLKTIDDLKKQLEKRNEE